ncbi:tRNA(adenine(34)) deaminase, chloroplastic isoform X2 [Tripterygium wilfordii]|uniref:tRNA(adenine(34)) deaminase, chloroplastic isoform X2 n=1 Tax=Tripterygium wilfordii TaxID=458696 RepID=UPI0018F8623A|nr:tRNA(adenine(34)) deaminase, chloroplastic isoform X2 [Tripterygium wilfordii]
MYNTYTSSTLLSVRTKGSVSFSFNDYSNLLNERFDKNPLSQSPCCCSCCFHCCSPSFASNRVALNPALFYGLRQSTLIQCSPSRRLILGGRDRYHYRVPIYGFDSECFEVYCSLKQRGCNEGIGRRRKRSVGYANSSERRCLGDAEAVISLLSEEFSEEFLGDTKRNGRMSKKVEAGKRGDYVVGSYRRKKKDVGLGFSDNNSKQQAIKSVGVESREEGYGRKEKREEKEASTRGENLRGRRQDSSCSSYYSLSSSGDVESDLEVQDNPEQLIEELSSGLQESRNKSKGRFEKQMVGELKRHTDDIKDHAEISEQRNSVAASYSGQDWRKKSEKKLTEVSIEGTHSREEASKLHGENDHVEASSSHNHIDQEDSSFSMNFENRTRNQFGKKDEEIRQKSFSQRQYQEISKISRTKDSGVETTSQLQQQFSDREGSHRIATESTLETRDNYHNIVSHRAENSNLQRESEYKMKIKEEDTALFQSSHQESGKHISQIDRKDLERMQFRRESRDITSLSVQASDRDTNNTSQRNSEKRMIDQGRNSTSVVKILRETKEKHTQTDETEIQFKSNKEHQRATKVSTHLEKASEEASGIEASLNLVSQARVQHVDVKEGSQQNVSAMLMAPPSQLVARDSQHVDPVDGTAVELSYESDSSALIPNSAGSTPAMQHETYGRDRQSENYESPLNHSTHEDALSSVRRFEESSMHFVGEFFEKARVEVSTSNVHREKVSLNEELMHEGQGHVRKRSDEYGFVEFQSKEHDSRQSSDSSAGKGPSDAMWDVRDTSVQQPPEVEEAPESDGSAIVRRTGRSLWSIIADVVRLRWRSHAETPKSAGRSRQKNSSNESVSSEAWFSGRDADETNDENVKGERRRRLHEASRPYQPELEKTSIQSEDEDPERIRLKGKVRQPRGEKSSSSAILKSELPSRGVFPNSEEGTSTNEDGQSSQGASVVVRTEEQLQPMPSRSTSESPIIEEIGGTVRTNISGSGSKELMVQPISSNLSEVSGSGKKEGELKQRKLQRSTQVPRDKFDDWEEAYRLESEQRKIDEMFMREALIEAQKAADTWEVPVGAVLVRDGKIIARGYNLVEELRDSTAHAEMICIREASSLLRSWRLTETTLYVTLEPCPMCAGAILQARINTLVWGAPNKLLGADGSWIRLFPSGGEGTGSEMSDKPAAPVHPFHPKMTIRRGVLETECADTMQQFFRRRRRKENKSDPSSPPSNLPTSDHLPKLLNKMPHFLDD